MPATDLESSLENRIEELATLGFAVEVERLPTHAPSGWNRTGLPWRAVLREVDAGGGTREYPEAYGMSATLALEAAVGAARRAGAQ